MMSLPAADAHEFVVGQELAKVAARLGVPPHTGDRARFERHALGEQQGGSAGQARPLHHRETDTDQEVSGAIRCRRANDGSEWVRRVAVVVADMGLLRFGRDERGRAVST